MILARFENLADRFDVGSTDVKYLNVKRFAKQFYSEANSGLGDVPLIEINETSISHNQPQSKLNEKHE